MTDLTIADGLATDVIDTGSFGTSTGGGGILNLGGSVTLSQVAVANNDSDTRATVPGEAGKPAQSYGGGIFNRSGARFTATHCVFSGNVATAARLGNELLLDVAGEGSFRLVPFPPERKRIDIGDFYADVSRVESVLGWSPAVALREGLAGTIAYYRRHREHYL